MKVFDDWADIGLGGYQTFTGLKNQNPNLKTLIALGGWNDSAFSTQYSELVADPVKMANFVQKALAFVLQVKNPNN
jgi:chitinase